MEGGADVGNSGGWQQRGGGNSGGRQQWGGGVLNL